MEIRYLDTTINITDSTKEQRIDQINQIFASLFEQNQIVQEVIIDGLTFREAYELYIHQNADDIRSIEFKTTDGDVLVGEILQEMRDYLPKLNRAIDSISDLFYGEMNSEGWSYFSQLVEGMQWMAQSIQVIRSNLERSGSNVTLQAELGSFEERFNALLLELGSAVERGEHVEAGDLIKYELGELFRQLESAIADKVIQ